MRGASIGLDAKGPTVKLTLTGLGSPRRSRPHVQTPIYTVSFHVQSPEWMRRPVKAMYAVSVARDAPGALWLYLPGRGEAGYVLNVGTILRDGQDGHWHRPSQPWAAAIAKYLPKPLASGL